MFGSKKHIYGEENKYEFNIYKILIDDILADNTFPLIADRQTIIDYLCIEKDKSLEYMNCFECVWTKYINRNKKFLRKTVDRAVLDVIENIKIINKDKEFIYKVQKIVLFGSYINSNKDKVGDLDIAIYLKLKKQSPDEVHQNILKSFETKKCLPFVDRMYYGQEEVIKKIRSRKHLLHIHNGDYVEKEAETHNVPCYIYQNKYKEILF